MIIKLTRKQRIIIRESSDVYRVMREILMNEQLLDREKEHFWMLGLANNNRLQYVELVSLGSVNATIVEPMNAFRFTVMKGCIKAIMVHNHPSGDLSPSERDMDMTDRLIQVGNILNIMVIEHLIISTKSYLSFNDTGLMLKLEKSEKYVPKFELVERIKREEKLIREQMVKEAAEKAEKKGKKFGFKEGEEKGIEKGKKLGIKEGKQIGFKEGEEIGIKKGKQQGIVEGKELGLKEGEKLKAVEMAKLLLQKGIDPSIIAETSGLTAEEVEKLRG